MTLSAEMTRFLADHATAESRAAFASGVETPPTAANFAAAMSAKGYQIGEAEILAVLEFSKSVALDDQQLDGAIGGQNIVNTFINDLFEKVASESGRLHGH
jgi:hypothetical protein